jgi:hypothetical protein
MWDQGSGIRDLSRSQSFTRPRRFTRSHPNKLISAQNPNIIPLLAFLAPLDVQCAVLIPDLPPSWDTDLL